MAKQKANLNDTNAILKPVGCFRMPELVGMCAKWHLWTFLMGDFRTQLNPLIKCGFRKLCFPSSHTGIKKICFRFWLLAMEFFQIYTDICNGTWKEIRCPYFSAFSQNVERHFLVDLNGTL